MASVNSVTRPKKNLKLCLVKVHQKNRKENCEEGMEIRVAEENGDCDRNSPFIGRLGASADEIKPQEEKQL